MATTAAMDSERSDFVRRSLTDLHTHILPHIDDGAKDLEASYAMLRREKERGVDRVMLTPHFYPLQEQLDDFLYRRQQAWDLLMQDWDANAMPQVQLGAEVRYSVELLDMDLSQLTLGGSEYWLLELSDQRLPAHLYEVGDQLLMRGITLVLAHIERCAYFREEPDRLLKLADLGVLMQVSAGALQNKKDRHFAQSCLQKGIAQIVASDAHNLEDRDPCLGFVANKIQEDVLTQAELAARAIWDKKPVSELVADPIKKTMFGYK